MGSGPVQIPQTFHVAESLSSLIVVFSQGWQFHRTLVVSGKNRFILGAGALMLAVSLAGTILFTLGFSKVKDLSPSPSREVLKVWNPFSGWVKVGLDLFLSGSFTIYVLRAERKALDASLGHRLHLLAVTALQAFLPRSILAAGRAIAGYVCPNTTLFAALLIVLAPCYSCSILYTLNARTDQREREESLGFMPLSDARGGSPALATAPEADPIEDDSIKLIEIPR